MHAEAHGNDTQNSLHRENNSKDNPTFFDHLVSACQVISIAIVVACQEHRIQKDNKYDKVLEPLIREQSDYLIANWVVFIKDINRFTVIYHKLFLVKIIEIIHGTINLL